MIDSHTHLDRLPGSEDEAVAAAAEAGVHRVLTIGTGADSSRAALAAAQRHPGVWAAVGLHPNSAAGFDDDAARALTELAADPHCLAVGETGLDYFHDGASRAEQEAAFRFQLQLARDSGKPVVIHSRDAEQDTLDVLADAADGLEVILHCFSMPARLEECLERGYWISYAGNVTYPRNAELADACARTPLDRILVETDAPYLTPQPQRKHRNQPAFVVHTAQFVAERQGLSYAQLEAAVEANGVRLLGW